MRKNVHPNEIDLARWCELDGGVGGARDDIAEHLRWCARCRSVAAGQRWLQDEVAAALTLAAGAVPVPRPRWWAVQEALLVKQQRQVRGWWTSALASVVASVCLMLSVSPILSSAFGAVTAASQTAPPVAIIATAPDTVLSTAPSAATPTPVVFRQDQDVRLSPVQDREGTRSPTPILALPPTPEI